VRGKVHLGIPLGTRGGSGRLSQKLYISQTGLYIGGATGLGRSPGQADTWDVVLGH
jgi:hypothetical protein